MEIQEEKYMNSKTIANIIKKTPKLRNKQEKLEAMQDGAYCWHASWGFGQINQYEEESGKLIIDFEGKQGHKMDPAFCADKLDILENDNLLVMYRTQKVDLDKQMSENPAELIVSILSKKESNSVSLIELENLLKQLFGYKLVNAADIDEATFVKENKAAEKQFRAWWNKTKEVLFRDPRIACPKTKTDSYVLRAEGEELKPEQEVLKEYFLQREPKKKIMLAEKLYKTATEESVKEIAESDMEKIKDELTDAIKNARSLNDADRLHGIWVRNNLVRYLYDGDEAMVEEISPRSKDIIKDAKERDPKDGLNELAKYLPNAYLERFLDLLTRVFAQNWRDIIIDLLKYSEGRLTKECVDFLLSWDIRKESKYVKDSIIPDDGKDKTSQDLIKEHFAKWLEEQALRGSVILWIVKNRNDDKYREILKDLIGQDLLSAMLIAIDDEALQRESIATTARIPLADILSDDKDLVADMLKGAGLETARDLAQSLMLNQGFEDLTKKDILMKFVKLYPKIKELVANRSTDVQDSVLLVSSWSMQSRREELEDLVKKQLPESKIAIEAARELGDLRENAEYKMAREHDEILSARRAILEREISGASVIDFTDAPKTSIGIGSVVELKTDKGEELKCTILGAWDSDTQKNIYSYKTPLATALIGHKVGETVETNINDYITKWTILDIKRYVDLAK